MADFWRRITKRKRLIVDAQGGGGTYIALSGDTIPDDASVGDDIGELSVVGGNGTYTFSIVNDPSGLFAIDGTAFEVGAALTAGTYPVEIGADNGVDDPLSRIFPITVTEVFVPADDSFLRFDQGGLTGIHLGMI